MLLPWRALTTEFRPLLKLAVPLILGELGWVTMSVVDAMMVGRLSKEAMGAVGVVSMLFITSAVFGMGLLLGLDPLVAQAFGAGRRADCHRSLVAALWLAAAIAPPMMLIQWASIPVMTLLRVHPAVLLEAIPYIGPIVWSTPPLLFYAALRRYLQGMNHVHPVMFALLSANVVNACVNWLLIFGHWGAPQMGVAGAGWATLASRVYMAGVLIAAAVWYARAEPHVSLLPEWSRIRELVRLGLPAAGQITAEVGVFALATTLIGRLDPQYLAANQIAMAAATYSYMVPLGLSSAAAVRVGHAIGRGDPRRARLAGWAAILFGVSFMGMAGLTFISAPRWIGRLFTPDASVIEAAIPLLGLIALFQLFDGAQGVATGALRGAGNTRVAAWTHFAGYWIVGLPAGAWLCFSAGWGAAGLWAGLCLAIILIGVTLLIAWAKLAPR